MKTSTENHERAAQAHAPRVVIIGGGFDGLYAARALARSPVSVTLVDRRNYHLFRPMLYQVATGLLSSDEIAAPIRSILRRQKNVTILLAEVVGVDPHSRVVLTREGTVAYDYLILATGIEYDYFGHEEWKRLAALGGSPHLLSDWVCESALGHAPVGDLPHHEATRRADSSTSTCGSNAFQSGYSIRRPSDKNRRSRVSRPGQQRCHHIIERQL